MRIVYVLTSLGMGGAERQVLALAERMDARGHTVALLVLRPRLAEEWPTRLNICHLNMRRAPLHVLAGMVRACRFLRSFQPDLLHSHSFHANFVARALTLFISTYTLVCTVHNVYEGGRRRMLAYRLTDGLSQCTTTVSAAAALRFMQLKAVSQDKCVVFTNGIDIFEFFPQEKRRAQVRTQMDAKGKYIWLTAGRIVPAKDYPNLLRAFAQVSAGRPETQLWIAGEGECGECESLFNRPVSSDRGSHSCAREKKHRSFASLRMTKEWGAEMHDFSAGSIRNLAIELGLADRVRWLGLRRDLPALLDAADGFVLASAWEGMPLALGEAMAMEKPVVATDVGGVRELVGEAGRIVPAQSPEGLAQAMLETMHNSMEERRALGHVARERIVKNFSMEAKVEEWEALYESILKPAHDPGF